MVRWLRKRKAMESAERVREIEADIARLDTVIREAELPEPPEPLRLEWKRDADGAWTCNGHKLEFTPTHAGSAHSGPHPVKWW